MVEILELVLAFVAVAIYGTEERPRHPLWKNSVRTVAFGGALISSASFLNLLGGFVFPLVVGVIWGICSLLLLMGEYYFGSKKIWLAAVLVFPIWLALGLLSESQ